MKRLYLFLLLVIVSGSAFSQVTVIMKINGITAAAGDKLTAFEGDLTMPTPAAGGASKPLFDNIKIKKPLSPSSYLVRSLLQGTHIATMEFDFLDNTNTLVYEIQLTEAAVTKFSNLSPECPTCQSLSNEIWFSFNAITYMDPINKKIVSFNIPKNTIE
jgi:type VI protein secretion system component Hcp